MRVKLFAKNKPGVNEAIDYLKTFTNELEIYLGELSDPFPEISRKKECDLIISYISPWIIPHDVLKLAQFYSINFHPGPPEYPGIGCTNFALYENADKFGVTCHIMEPKVDTGKLISVKRFPIYQNDNVKTLSDRCYVYILEQFYEVITQFFKNNSLDFIDEKWKRKPFTRKELNKLSEINLEMSESEINARIRATYFPNMPYPFIIVNGNKFCYRP